MDVSLPGRLPVHSPRADDPLMRKAQELEAGFLAEMLAQTGLGTTPESFGGGMGEDHFASFLRAEQARLIVERGGLGLAESFFRAMTETRNGG